MTGRAEPSSRDVASSPLLLFAVVTAAYSLLALSAYELFGALSIGVTFFPPAGLTFACFLLLPRRTWPVIAAAIVVGEVLVDTGQGQGLWWSLGWASANLVEPFVGAAVTRRIAPVPELTRRFALAVTVGGLLVGPACGAAIGAAVLTVAEDMTWLESFPDVWVGDALGVLVIAPLLIVLGRPEGFVPSAPRRADPLIVIVAMAVASVVLFRTDSIPAGYAVVPLLGLTALRYSARELSFAAVVVSASLTAATANGRGPWAGDDAAGAHAQLLQQQVFLLVAIVGAWLLKLEVRERVYAVRAAQHAEAQLARATERARQQRHLAGMHEALTDLAASATTEEVAELAVQHGRDLFDADGIVVLLDDPASEALVTLAAAAASPPPGADPDRPTLPAIPDEMLARAITDGRPTFESAVTIDGAPIDGSAIGPLAAVLPFTVARSRRGLVGIARRVGLPWSESAQVRAIAFGSIVADALERTEQAAVDRQIALTLQHALIPDEMVTPPGVAVAGRYLPASASLEVGGDWYDVIPSTDGHSATMIIGDVVGHSLQAAAAMGKLAAAARALAYAGLSPAGILEVLDRIAAHTPDATMTTMLCASLCPGSGELRYAAAGHPPAMLLEPSGLVRPLDGGRGLPLAVAAPGPRDEAVEHLADRSMLCLYTDGLVERRDEAIDTGLDRLQRVLAGTDPSDPGAACDELTTSLIGGTGPDDDVAVLCITLGG